MAEIRKRFLLAAKAFIDTKDEAAAKARFLQETWRLVQLLGSERNDLAPLWDQPIVAARLLKLLSASLRRANNATPDCAYYGYVNIVLSSAVLRLFDHRMRAADSASPACRAALVSAARSIIGRRTLHGYARLVALEAEGYVQAAGAAAPAGPKLSVNDMDTHAADILVVIFGLLREGGALQRPVPAEGLPEMRAELLAALADSQLLEHAAKLVFAVPGASRTARALVPLTFCLVPCLRPHLRDLGLPGPCLLHLFTAATVEGLRDLEAGGGRGGRYGLPDAAAAAARPLHEQVDASWSVAAAGAPPGARRRTRRWVDQSVLYCWTQLLSPGAGLPPHRFFNAAAAYHLSMQLSRTSLRGLAEVMRGYAVCMGGSRAQQRPQGQGAAGAGVESTVSDLFNRRFLCLGTAADSLVNAHAALCRRLQAARASAGGSTERQALTVEGSGGGSEPVRPGRPQEWWRLGVEVIASFAAPLLPGWPAGDPSEAQLVRSITRLAHCQLTEGEMGQPLPDRLPPAPPPDAAAALTAGFLESLDALLRSRFGELLRATPGPGNMAPWSDVPTSLLSWPPLGWLLAYGETKWVVSLVGTVRDQAMRHMSRSDAPVQERMMAGSAVDASARAALAGLDWIRVQHPAAAAGDGVRAGGSTSSSSRAGASSRGSGGGVGGAAGAGTESGGLAVGPEPGGAGGSGFSGSNAAGAGVAPAACSAPAQRLVRHLLAAVREWLPMWAGWVEFSLTECILFLSQVEEAFRGRAVRAIAKVCVNILDLLSSALDFMPMEGADECQGGDGGGGDGGGGGSGWGDGVGGDRGGGDGDGGGGEGDVNRGGGDAGGGDGSGVHRDYVGSAARQAGPRSATAVRGGDQSHACAAAPVARTAEAWREALFAKADVPRLLRRIAEAVAQGVMPAFAAALLGGVLRGLLLRFGGEMRRHLRGGTAGERGGAAPTYLRLFGPGGPLADASLAALLRNGACEGAGDRRMA